MNTKDWAKSRTTPPTCPSLLPLCVWRKWGGPEWRNKKPYWGRFICCNRCTNLVGDIDNGRGYVYGGALGNFCTFQSFCCEPKTTLKKWSLLKNVSLGEMEDSVHRGRGHVDFLIFTVLTGNWKVSWVEVGRGVGTNFTRIGLLGWVNLSWLTCPICKAFLSGFYWGFTREWMFKNKNSKIFVHVSEKTVVRKMSTADWIDTPLKGWAVSY